MSLEENIKDHIHRYAHHNDIEILESYLFIFEKVVSQSVQHALEEAAENARLKIEGRKGNYKRYFIPLKEEPLIIDKQSILEIKTKYQPITE